MKEKTMRSILTRTLQTYQVSKTVFEKHGKSCRNLGQGMWLTTPTRSQNFINSQFHVPF